MQKEVKVNPQEILSSPYSCNLIQPKPAPYKIVLVDDDGNCLVTKNLIGYKRKCLNYYWDLK